ncbi:nascent polypeptide-associated complex subunit alpha, muscle-specific form-like [Mastomys coucha]|uniref:nascent polypeptide-associated complex subunit alpha, muscle-specific form-like n=1 Tax=Mastomys coucha TaxID=35658 RepID=UPI0012621B5A|nr:nascent polypeptide-associated complex subunit alpha, muscle-specific form-like [Mastomys coucha]
MTRILEERRLHTIPSPGKPRGRCCAAEPEPEPAPHPHAARVPLPGGRRGSRWGLGRGRLGSRRRDPGRTSAAFPHTKWRPAHLGSPPPEEARGSASPATRRALTSAAPRGPEGGARMTELPLPDAATAAADPGTRRSSAAHRPSAGVTHWRRGAPTANPPAPPAAWPASCASAPPRRELGAAPPQGHGRPQTPHPTATQERAREKKLRKPHSPDFRP